MKLEIESTNHIVLLDGMPARVWNGRTEKGTACEVYVVRIGTDRTAGEGEWSDLLLATAPKLESVLAGK